VVSHDKLIQILSDKKCSSHKIGLGFDKFVASSLHVVSTSKTLFFKSKISDNLSHVDSVDK
jgi:hypothetical protein